ncbi:MAG: phenylacetic acid degradation protein PaaY [Parahaliea sp.]
MPVYSIDGIVPVVDPSAYVHETAVLIGDVIVGPQVYVGPNAVMRGDFGRLILEAGANLQDTCVMHGFPGTDTVVGEHGHIGHGAVLHGCRIGRNTLVGMNAVIMDDAEISPECIVAACAFVKARFRCEARSMLVGSPARLLRQVTDQEIAWKSRGTAHYQDLARRSLQSLRPAQPLAAVEADRPRIVMEDVEPLYKSRG